MRPSDDRSLPVSGGKFPQSLNPASSSREGGRESFGWPRVHLSVEVELKRFPLCQDRSLP
jgi:hypothetical protein